MRKILPQKDYLIELTNGDSLKIRVDSDENCWFFGFYSQKYLQLSRADALELVENYDDVIVDRKLYEECLAHIRNVPS